MPRTDHDPLKQMRAQVRRIIDESYRCVDDFCVARQVNRATVSNFLRQRKDFQVSTLVKLASALDKQLNIHLT